MKSIQGKWTKQQAWAWHESLPRLHGCNYIPAYAINQLEMWQAQSFDLSALARELDQAADFGLNSLRVFLHDLLWQEDAEGFAARIDQFLSLAAERGINVTLVIFDDCWQDNPKLGRQPDPTPGLHGSGWAMSPGSRALNNPAEWPRLEAYVRWLMRSFGKDSRVVMWDVYNEVSNRFMQNYHLPRLKRKIKDAWYYMRNVKRPGPAERLMCEAFAWCREEKPDQPLSAPIYWEFPRLNRVILDLSDVINFHNYEDAVGLQKQIDQLTAEGRPLICTEWLSRPVSTFQTHLDVFDRNRVDSYFWGLVDGKTNTKFGWEHPPGLDAEPAVWFHDVLRADGRPYDEQERVLSRAQGLNGS